MYVYMYIGSQVLTAARPMQCLESYAWPAEEHPQVAVKPCIPSLAASTPTAHYSMGAFCKYTRLQIYIIQVVHISLGSILSSAIAFALSLAEVSSSWTMHM